jgi:hypothetical protein
MNGQMIPAELFNVYWFQGFLIPAPANLLKLVMLSCARERKPLGWS